MDEMRQVLQEGQVEQRVQYLLEGLFKVQRDGFGEAGFPKIPEGLDLVEPGDRTEVQLELEDPLEVQQMLNVFKPDPEYEAHEKEYEVSGTPATRLGIRAACSSVALMLSDAKGLQICWQRHDEAVVCLAAGGEEDLVR